MFDLQNQCSTLTVARFPGATKNFIRAGKFSTVFARLGNNELHRLLDLNSPPTLVVNMFKIKKYHNTIVAKIAMLEIRSFVDHKLAVFTYFKRNGFGGRRVRTVMKPTHHNAVYFEGDEVQ